MRERSPSWRWWVCGLLLLATMVNYMDRLTLSQLASQVKGEFKLDDNAYADVQSAFALAFAGGAVLFGILVDRFNVYWVYPLAVLAWSAAGFATGFAGTFTALLACRVALGLAESANWPCALRTTQHVLPPNERSMGNGILQSGAALGAVLLPLVLFLLYDEARPETWRRPFVVIGVAGSSWVLLWWGTLRPADLRREEEAPVVVIEAPSPRGPFARRFAVLVVLVVSINMTWHFLAAWYPLYLKEHRDFTQERLNWFSAAYYVSTDLGALFCGWLGLRLARGGLSVRVARLIVYAFGAALAALAAAIPYLADGGPLEAALLLVGFGSLGVFPIYYSFTQDLTTRHQGKLTGSLSCFCWVVMAGWQKAIGWMVTETGSYEGPFLVSAVAPLVGLGALALFWGADSVDTEGPRE